MAQSNDENVPQKCIVSPAALEAFLASPTHTLLVDFIVELNQSVIGIPLRTNDCVVSTAVESILALLDRVAEVIVRHPPTDTSSRFGNAAFRDFYDDVRRASLLLNVRMPGQELMVLPLGLQNASHWHENIPHLPAERIPEVATYFVQAWGDRERIDYGSGMELNFLCWLSVSRGASTVARSLTFLSSASVCDGSESSPHKMIVLWSCESSGGAHGLSRRVARLSTQTTSQIHQHNAPTPVHVLARTRRYVPTPHSMRPPFEDPHQC